MKNLKFLFGIFALAGLIGLFSCSEDEDPIAPLLEVKVSPGTTVAPNTTLTFTIEARDGDAKLSTMTIEEGNTPVTGWNEKEIPNAMNEIYMDTVTLNAPANADETTVFKFTVTDKDGETSSISIDITTEASTNPIDTYSSITLVSAFLSATSGSQFLDATTGISYRHDATSAENATFGFISGGGSGAVIMTSGSSLSFTQQPTGWSTGAKIAETTLTAGDFDAISDEADLLAAIPANITADDITGLEDGGANAGVTVIAFNDDGKKGLIKLPTSLNNNKDQSITVDIKVQQ
jgi:hypothetical protein